MLILPAKDPDEVLNYTLDWAERLAGDTLTGTPSVTVSGAVKDGQSNSASAVSFKISGGTGGTVAKIVVRATTVSGATIEDTVVLEIGGEAVSLAEAKAHQKITSSAEDALLAGYLRAAVRAVENRTSKNLTPQIETQICHGFPCAAPHTNPVARAIRLWKGPVGEILSVAYDDSDGAEQPLGSFRLVEGKYAKLLPAAGEYWPSTAAGDGTVRISYVAGYDASDRDLRDLTQAVLLLFGHFNVNREAAVAGNAAQSAELPLGVQYLIEPYCPIGIG